MNKVRIHDGESAAPSPLAHPLLHALALLRMLSLSNK